ncbi:MAG TPA: amylo-alpha-1,6-glucosidase [Gemmatimonadaceae bacterium]|jgi:predicted glycogen debranching enzyme
MTRRLFDRVVRRLDLPSDRAARAQTLIDTEWLVTNGIGGYSSSSLAGVITRRYHGILVAALPNPLGRMVMLNHIGERISAGGVTTMLNGEERVGGKIDVDVASVITDVRLEGGLPVWEYYADGVKIEKRIIMPHKQNTVYISYRLLNGPPTATLALRPAVHFRGYEDRVDTERNAPLAKTYAFTARDDLHEISVDGDLPSLRLLINGAKSTRFVADPRTISENLYPVEESRGYEFVGALWTPGHFDVEIARDECVTLVASCESEDVMRALDADEAVTCEQERRRRLVDSALPQAQDEIGAELVLAADQFIITPKGRVIDATRASAMGNEIRTVIAGYHWFTDWGRDTMISLEGLTLMTGRDREASFILRTFAHYVRDGLIPNMFPDGSSHGLYHTADATLWFFHAVEAYVRRTGDQTTLTHLLPTMLDIVAHHIKGTHYGIGVDPKDDLLKQGAEGYQLTWMDAKVDDWVVTPRRGKPVEINALWYNALRLTEGWLEEIRGKGAGKEMADRAERVYKSFNERFWNEERGMLFDLVDPDDPAEGPLCRPNQIFSISLDHPVLDRSRWDAVMKVVQDKLLTPVGLRSLAPGEPNFKSRYFGDLRSRDAAYHQGTVWGWLIGPWVDAWMKAHPGDTAGGRAFLDGCIGALDAFGLGTIAEVFDAEPPYTARGCIAQAWSVAEVLRCWVKTASAKNVDLTGPSGNGTAEDHVPAEALAASAPVHAG